MERMIKNSRGEKKRRKEKTDYFKSKLGFKLHDIAMNKEESVKVFK